MVEVPINALAEGLVETTRRSPGSPFRRQRGSSPRVTSRPGVTPVPPVVSGDDSQHASVLAGALQFARMLPIASRTKAVQQSVSGAAEFLREPSLPLSPEHGCSLVCTATTHAGWT